MLVAVVIRRTCLIDLLIDLLHLSVYNLQIVVRAYFPNIVLVVVDYEGIQIRVKLCRKALEARIVYS